MRRLVSAYIVLVLLFLPLLADGSAGALANLRVQAAVLLFSCLGAAIALWRKEGKAAITAVDAWAPELPPVPMSMGIKATRPA